MAGGADAEKTNQPPWIVAGEIVQTSQLFARTVARINPEWVAELGAHLCKFSYADPHWNEKSGRVLAWERVLIYGLEIVRRRIDYGKIDPAKATELFIRGALVAGEAQIEHHFFKHNRELRERIEAALTRVRDRRVDDLDEAFYRFYAARIEAVSSVHDLNRLVRARITREPEFLCADEATLLPSSEDGFAFDRTLFPEQVAVGNTALPLSYAYAPGEERDGVTVRVPLPVAANLTTGQLQWMVPGLREEQIGTLLRALPKSVRKSLMPLDPKVREVAAEFEPGRGDFLTALADFLTRRFGVDMRAADWPAGSLPVASAAARGGGGPGEQTGRSRAATSARSRRRWKSRRAFGCLGARGEALGAARRENLELRRPARIGAWSKRSAARRCWRFPGLAVRGGEVDVRLFRKRAEAEAASRAGVRRLAERALERDLAWVRKELGNLLSKGPPTKPTGPVNLRSALDAWSGVQAKPAAGERPASESLQDAALRHVGNAVLTLVPVLPLKEARFQAMIDAARRELPLLARRTGELVVKILDQRRQILASTKRYAGLQDDLARLASDDFPARTPPDQLAQLPRYLRAVAVRAERAAVQPAKDAEKARALAPFADWETRVPSSQRETFRWLLEEFRVSIFAQELGTAQPVSAQRLKTVGGYE